MSGGVMANESRITLISVAALILASVIPAVIADCDVEGLRCCATEFLPLITAKSGFSLDEESINKSCTVVDPTFQCLSDYEEQCKEVLQEEDMLVIDKVKTFLTDFCSPYSRLSKEIEQRRQCIMATSPKLKSCASKKDFRSDNPWSKPCCEYSMLKACAESTIQENCLDEVRVLVRNLVENINGIGYERVCEKYYDTCGNSAPATAVTTLVFLISAVGVLVTTAL